MRERRLREDSEVKQSLYLSPAYLRLIADAMEATRIFIEAEPFSDLLQYLKFKLRDTNKDLYDRLIKEELRMMK